MVLLVRMVFHNRFVYVRIIPVIMQVFGMAIFEMVSQKAGSLKCFRTDLNVNQNSVRLRNFFRHREIQWITSQQYGLEMECLVA